MSEIVAIDIGGTHARFALAEIEGVRVRRLGEAVILNTADHGSLEEAWRSFRGRIGGRSPPAAAIALAGLVEGDMVRLTNGSWTIRPATLAQELRVERLTLVNDFGAVGHAVALLGAEHFTPLCGPPGANLPSEGAICIVGPGTGLGVALLHRGGGAYHVIETEGGHIAFAPLDAVEDRILSLLRERFHRVSVERLLGGMGLVDIHAALGGTEPAAAGGDVVKSLWTAALAGDDSPAREALDRYCLCLGAIAGDLALAHGASAVVVAGGLGLRLARYLPESGFGDRFVDKGRFRRRMEEMPVKLLIHRQPGLFGAAAAFARQHC